MGAKGKYVFGQLKNKAPVKLFSDSTVASHVLYPERAESLKSILKNLLDE